MVVIAIVFSLVVKIGNEVTHDETKREAPENMERLKLLP